jgi:hypothetical protein
LEKLRNSKDVSEELQNMRAMVNSMADSKQVTLKELLSNTELRWPLLITVLLILSQQFSGINAVNLSF